LIGGGGGGDDDNIKGVMSSDTSGVSGGGSLEGNHFNTNHHFLQSAHDCNFCNLPEETIDYLYKCHHGDMALVHQDCLRYSNYDVELMQYLEAILQYFATSWTSDTLFCNDISTFTTNNRNTTMLCFQSLQQSKEYHDHLNQFGQKVDASVLTCRYGFNSQCYATTNLGYSCPISLLTLLNVTSGNVYIGALVLLPSSVLLLYLEHWMGYQQRNNNNSSSSSSSSSDDKLAIFEVTFSSIEEQAFLSHLHEWSSAGGVGGGGGGHV
jgi:hypothetical protein